MLGKKVLSVFMAFVLAVGLCPAAASASLVPGSVVTAQDAGAGVNADVEPNDSMDTASMVQLDVLYSGQCTCYDYDYYRFSLSEAGLLSVEVTGSPNVAVYDDSTKESIFLSSSSGVCSAHVTAGVYYLRLDYSYSSSCPYTFRITNTSAGESFKETQGGSNNSIATASAVRLGTAYRGQIAENDEVDYYRIDLSSSGRLRISGQLIRGGSYSYGQLGLYNTSGVEITYYREWESGNREFAWEVDLVSGTYYLKVSYVHSYGNSVKGNYSFTPTFASANESFPESLTRNDNVVGTANKIALGTTYQGQLAENDGKDMYRFTTTGSGVVRVTADSAMHYTYYSVCDAYGDSIKQDEGRVNSETGRQDFSMTVDCGVGEQCLAVEKYSGYTGPYTFKVEELPSIAAATISSISSPTYNGSECKPTFKLEYGGRELQLGVDYEVQFSNNVDAGSNAGIEITGIGGFTGAKSAKFTIRKAAQSLKVKGGTWNLNRNSLRYEPITLMPYETCSYSGNIGKVTFKKVKANRRNGKFKVKSDGTVIVKKGRMPKGKYKLKIKATAKGDSNHNSVSKVFTVKLTVKSW